MKPTAYKVRVRGNKCSISGVAQSARGTKFLTRTLSFDKKGMTRDAFRDEVLKFVQQLEGRNVS